MKRTFATVLLAASLLSGCAVLTPPRLQVAPTARTVGLAEGGTTTFSVTNDGAAGSVLRWRFEGGGLVAMPERGDVAAGDTRTVSVRVVDGVAGQRRAGTFVGGGTSVQVTIVVVEGMAFGTCAPDTAFAALGQPGESVLLVGYHPRLIGSSVDRGAAAGRVAAIVRDAQGRLVRRGVGRGHDIVAVPQQAAGRVLERLAALPHVAYATPDVPIRRSSAPNDPLYTAAPQWNLEAFGAEPAWAEVDGVALHGDPIVIAVVDDGVAVAHADLRDRLLPGWDLVGRDPDVRNCTDHGTHVTGIAVAARGDGYGVAGVASVPWVRLLPVKVWGDGSDPEATTSISFVLDGMRWAGGLPVGGLPENPYPADVVNLSLGMVTDPGGPVAVAFEMAIDELHERGVVVVAAAGNGGRGDGVDVPAAAGAIAVGSADADFTRSSFSTYGPGLDLLAPGGYGPFGACSGVTSTGVTYAAGTATETWTCKLGTSMATPFVSGAAALLLGTDPAVRHASPATRAALVRDRLRVAAAERPAGRDAEYGAGVLCLDALLTTTHVCGAPR